MTQIKKYCGICGWESKPVRGYKIVRDRCPVCKSKLHKEPITYLPIDTELNDLIKDTTRVTGLEASELMKNAIRIYRVAMTAIKEVWGKVNVD